VLGVELLDELRGIGREPAALFFSVLMPVGFYALFASLFDGYRQPGGQPVAAVMLATYGTFGVVSVVLLNPGIGVAEARSRGWLRVKKVSGVPVGTTLAAKVIASLPYALGVLLAMTAVSLVVAGPALAVAAWHGADPMTDRERDVLRLAADGLPNTDIAARLHLAEGTVRNYLSTAISKLGTRNRIEAARVALDRGWL
jgi:DNA-binding CsgD family transcriptional regulator